MQILSKSIQRIAGAFGLPTGTSVAQTRKLIERKLKESGCQPSQVQVIVQGTSGDDNVYLVDEKGIIISIKGVPSHVSDHAQVDGGISSALRKSVSDPRHVCPTSDQLSSRVEELTAKLQMVNERASGREKDTEIETLKSMLAKEKQHVKKHWRERCEQLMRPYRGEGCGNYVIKSKNSVLD